MQLPPMAASQMERLCKAQEVNLKQILPRPASNSRSLIYLSSMMFLSGISPSYIICGNWWCVLKLGIVAANHATLIQSGHLPPKQSIACFACKPNLEWIPIIEYGFCAIILLRRVDNGRCHLTLACVTCAWLITFTSFKSDRLDSELLKADQSKLSSACRVTNR